MPDQIPKTQNLNDSQLQAVMHNGGHLLIVAGPGTGKTHTLTHRIANNIGDRPRGDRPHGACPQILAITFTNKAAQEMRERLEKQLDDAAFQSVTVGTFHSFCLQTLTEHINQTDLPKDFKVADDHDLFNVAKEIWPAERASQRKKMLEKISQWKSTNFSIDAPPNIVLYNCVLREHNLVDFDDLLVETIKLLTKNSDVLNQTHSIFKHVFVDEYQDINAAQHALLKLLVQDDVVITAIGDPNQAIYGFRGSDVKYFEQFASDFLGATTLSLNENYRSTANLLSASGQVISKDNRFEVPELTAKIYTEGRLTLYAAASDKAEAEYIVHQIEKMVGGTTRFSQDSGRVDQDDDIERSFGDIAVLYRMNHQNIALKEAFERSGIPYQTSGEKFQFSDDGIDYKAEKVSLMTLHASKGLEFPVVFIVGCEQTLLPLDLAGMHSSIEEERRLFYVGMTRAKERLYLLRAKRRRMFGKTANNEPSPFLSDIEESLKAYEQQKPLPKKDKPKDPQEDQLNLF